jgi:hypothetical protein
MLHEPSNLIRKEVSIITPDKLTKLYNSLTDSLRLISLQFGPTLQAGHYIRIRRQRTEKELRNEENIRSNRPMPEHRGYGDRATA